MSFISSVKRYVFWIKDIVSGGTLWKHYKLLTRLVNESDNYIAERRKQLSDIIQYAKRNTHYYKDISGERLSDFPVITKSDILARYDDFCVPVESIPGQKGPLHIHRTSGSTGTPFKICQDTISWLRRTALIKVSNDLIGFHSFEPLLHLRSLKHYFTWGDVPDFFWRKDLGILYADNAAMNDDMLARLILEMKRRKIRFIRGYVTSIDILTSYIVKQRVQFEYPMYIIAGGEMLTEPVRSRIVDILHWNVVSQYANEENGVIGQSILNQPADYFKLYLANCYVEILKLDSDDPVDENELGRIVVTDYTNHSMPLIRYDIGDLAMVASRTKDGEVTAIKNIAGRRTQILYKTNGEAIDFFNCISPEIFNNPLIRQWQFIQEGQSEYQFNLCGYEVQLSPLIPHFINLIKQVVGDDASITVNISDTLPILSSGKREIVVQHYHPE